MLNPQNVGLVFCKGCGHRRPCLGLGDAGLRICSDCTRSIVAGWAVLGRMYPHTAAELVAEARAALGEETDPNKVTR